MEIPPLTPDAERFLSHVNKTDTCWYWTGYTDRDGYGVFNVNAGHVQAHIYAYGDVPPGYELDHRCHNEDLTCPGDATCIHRQCVNREHLEPVTHAVNLQRRHARTAFVQTLTAIADNEVRSPPTDTGKQKRRAPHTAFAAGYDPRRNLAGRPRKGESLPEMLKRAIERPKTKQAVVGATVNRLLREDAVGNRAFADVRDTVYGIPKQTLVLEQADSPLAAFYERMTQRQLPPPDITPDTSDTST